MTIAARFDFCDDAPLLEDLRVVPAQSVDALHDQRVARPQPPQHPPILHPFKIRPRLLVHVNIPRRDPYLPHGGNLPRFILFFRGYADVSVDLIHLPSSKTKSTHEGTPLMDAF